MDDIHPPLEDRPEADVRSLLERLEIRTIEARDTLRTEHARTGQPVYYDGDRHLNVAGSRVVGEAVGAELLESTSR